MFDMQSLFNGDIRISTTENRGFTPEEIAERALNKIIYIGKDAHPALKEQAEAYREHIKHVLIHYMHEAIRSNHTTMAIKLRESGHPELISILEI